jgi:hypothetical protein
MASPHCPTELREQASDIGCATSLLKSLRHRVEPVSKALQFLPHVLNLVDSQTGGMLRVR